jgi:outer membrane protein TolC
MIGTVVDGVTGSAPRPLHWRGRRWRCPAVAGLVLILGQMSDIGAGVPGGIVHAAQIPLARELARETHVASGGGPGLVEGALPAVAQAGATGVPASASTTDSGLRALLPEEVLRSSARSFPKILEAIEKAAASRAKLLAAQGEFDLEWRTKSLNWLSGFYEGQTVDSKVVKPIAEGGINLAAGYRISAADFPIYQDEYVTNDLGEVNFEVIVSLLRDRQFDFRRFKLRDAAFNVDLADLELLTARMQVQHAALRTYWDWLAAGQRYQVYSELLGLADTRDSAFRQRIAEGDLAEIFLVENSQNLLRRQSFVVQAARDFRVASIQLGLYLRNGDGEPMPPTEDRLPADFPGVSASVIDDLEQDLERAMNRQVFLARVDTELAAERNRLALGRNAYKPQVDLGVKLARDFGEGSVTRMGNDVIVELDVSFPIQRRKAQGAIDEARANIRSLEQRRRFLVDQLDAQVLSIAERVAADVRFSQITSQEVVQARQLEQAERVRFDEGASDFFVVNVREERTADAQVRSIDARQAYFKALADYYAATVDLGALEIEQDSVLAP